MYVCMSCLSVSLSCLSCPKKKNYNLHAIEAVEHLSKAEKKIIYRFGRTLDGQHDNMTAMTTYSTSNTNFLIRKQNTETFTTHYSYFVLADPISRRTGIYTVDADPCVDYLPYTIIAYDNTVRFSDFPTGSSRHRPRVASLRKSFVWQWVVGWTFWHQYIVGAALVGWVLPVVEGHEHVLASTSSELCVFEVYQVYINRVV